MDYSLAAMGGVVLLLFSIAYFSQGWSLVITGLDTSARVLRTVWFRMLLGLVLGGLIQVLISPTWVNQ